MKFQATRVRSAFAMLFFVLFAPWATTFAAPAATFATAQQAAALLGSRDEFVERMSPFDRAARMKTDRDVSEAEYLAFVKTHVRDWGDDEGARKAAQALSFVEQRFGELGLAFPAGAQLVRTTGREEGGAAHTRGTLVVLPDTMLASAKIDLRHIVAHELFHVISRRDPALRTALYRVIGFTPVAEFKFPRTLVDRRITNPDAPRNDHAIEVSYQGEKLRAVPILYADPGRYDPARGGEFFDYLQFRLALPTPGKSARLVEVGDVGGFFEQVGRNTDYIIHPEEILAENFAALVVGETKALPTPAIPDAIGKLLRADP